MKKIKVFLFMFLLGLGTLLAQTPGAFNYQAVLRDAEGKIISNQDVSIQISILQQSTSGEVVFQEKHSASTNEFGLIVLEIGNGIPITGTLAEINWGESTHFLKVELDATGGELYTDMGTSRMLSVPYALYAKSSGSNFSGKYSDLEGTPQLPNDISDLSDAGKLLFDGNYNSLTNKPDLSQLSTENTDGWDKNVSDDFDGNYNSLINKPTTISPAQETAINANTAKISNVRADWNAATGEAQILNKPDLTVYIEEVNTTGWDKNASDDFSGSFNDLSDLPTNLDTDATDDFDGDYNSLANKPTTISAAQATAIDANTAKVSNVIADWNAATGEAQILNKPDLTVYVEEANTTVWDKNAADDFDGDYNSLINKPTTISAAQASAIDANTAKVSNVKADWNAATGEAQILSKPDLTVYVEEANTTVWDKNAADDFDGDYNSLTNKPTTISAAQATAIENNIVKISNVKADWNAATGEAQILNKPDLTVYVEEANTTGWDKNASDDFDGDYNSLTNKPTTISAAQTKAIENNTAKISNVKADWDALTGEAQILNKPDLTVYVEEVNTTGWDKNTSDDFDGDYNSLTNKPTTISAAQATAIETNTAKISNVKADWSATTGEAQILNKPDLTVYIEEANTSSWDKDANDDFSGSFNDLTDLPSNLDTDSSDDFDGEYSSLTNIPTPNILKDEDADTKIQVEESTDDDVIRFDIAGLEKLILTDKALEFKNLANNIIIGEMAGNSFNKNAPITNNVFIGMESGKNSTTGFMTGAHGNTFVGSRSGKTNTTGRENVAVGNAALTLSTTGSDNIAIGSASLGNNTSGNTNIAIGQASSSYNTTGGENISIGKMANFFNSTGGKNIAIGYQAGLGSEGTNQMGNIMIGFQAGSKETESNKLYIENSNSASPLIYGEFDNDLLRINGTLDINNAYQLPTADGTAGQYLSTDGAGATQWTDAPEVFDGDYNSLTNQPDLTDLHDHSGTGENSFIGGGIENTAAGLLATASGGQKNTASGYYSTIAGGYSNTAAYAANVGGGTVNKALGFHSTVVGGQGNTAWSYGETVMGFYSPYYAAESISEYKANDRLFVIANGTGDGSRSNALVMLKNGNTTLNGELTINNGQAAAGNGYTLPTARGTDGQFLTTDGAGTTQWASISENASINTISSSYGIQQEDGFDVILSDGKLVILPSPSQNNGRVITVKNTGTTSVTVDQQAIGVDKIDGQDNWELPNQYDAIKVISDGSQWHILSEKTQGHSHSGNEYDNSFIGVNNSNTATGGYSAVVAGNNNTSSGNTSAILGGSGNTASGVMATIVTGFNNKALSQGSFVTNGINNIAVGDFSVVIGAHSNSAQSYGETVLGMFNDTLETINSRTSYNANDRLLVIGNGSGPARSNALVMLKNGNTTLNGQLTINNGTDTEYTLPANNGTDGQVLSTNGAGVTQWTDAPASFDGDYNSLTNLPTTISTVQADAIIANSSKISNVQADWNATNGDALILNKPDLNSYATKAYVDTASTTAYEVGDFAQGGVVFWVDETGQHGLVCAKSDLSMRYAYSSFTYSAAGGNGVFAGEMNTLLIITSVRGENTAAKQCANLAITENGIQYGDWYLPSEHEVLLMYQNKSSINTTALANGGTEFATSVPYGYTSSTEVSTNQYRRVDISTGSVIDCPKDSQDNVRPIRSF
ncbi:hypothetical protein [uncultured Draconibacterium sp.]|uniref:hypothetical protein n=1 Tax=uncultured Draconibacterium sp. TaxID=1573823 RepID=UPI0029C906C0|nr:hypothetical protein [uncultured Draconibacterium sp.]